MVLLSLSNKEIVTPIFSRQKNLIVSLLPLFYYHYFTYCIFQRLKVPKGRFNKEWDEILLIKWNYHKKSQPLPLKTNHRRKISTVVCFLISLSYEGEFIPCFTESFRVQAIIFPFKMRKVITKKNKHEK